MTSRYSDLSLRSLDELLRTRSRPDWPALLDGLALRGRPVPAALLAAEPTHYCMLDDGDAAHPMQVPEPPIWADELVTGQTLERAVDSFCYPDAPFPREAEAARRQLSGPAPLYRMADVGAHRVFRNLVTLGGFTAHGAPFAIWQLYSETTIPRQKASMPLTSWCDDAVEVHVHFLKGWFPQGWTRTLGNLVAQSVAAHIAHVCRELGDKARQLPTYDPSGVIPVWAKAFYGPKDPWLSKVLCQALGEAARLCNGAPFELSPNTCYIGSTSVQERDARQQEHVRTVLARLLASPKAETYVPGQEFHLLETDLKALRVTETGHLYSVSAFERYEQFIRDVGRTPEDVFSHYGLAWAHFPEITALPLASALPEFLRAYVTKHALTPFFGTEQPVDDLVAVLLRAWPLQAPPRLSPLRATLRMMVDQATGVGYAEVCLGDADFAPFLERALADRPHTLLNAPPERLLLPRSLTTRYPDIEPWARKRGVPLVHPDSGGDAGAHYSPAWRRDLEQFIDTPSAGSQGFPLSQVQQWLTAYPFVAGALTAEETEGPAADEYAALLQALDLTKPVTGRADATRFCAATHKFSFADAMREYIRSARLAQDGRANFKTLPPVWGESE